MAGSRRRARSRRIAEAANLKINCGGLAVLSQLEAAAGAHFYASRPAAHVMPGGEFIFGLGVIGPDPLVPDTDFVVKDGHVSPPSGPGLGVTVDDARARRRTRCYEVVQIGRSMGANRPVPTSRPRLGSMGRGAHAWIDACGRPEHLKLCVFDSIGCGLYGAAQPWGRIAGDVAVALSGGGTSSLFAPEGQGQPSRRRACQWHRDPRLRDRRRACVVVAASRRRYPAGCLAVRRGRRDASGADLLTALAAGYEVGLRVGICAGVSHSTSGYHVTGTAGTLASAAAAARISRLSPEQTAHALAIGATQAAGLYSARIGAMTKRFHAGRASQSGVLAALLRRAASPAASMRWRRRSAAS